MNLVSSVQMLKSFTYKNDECGATENLQKYTFHLNQVQLFKYSPIIIIFLLVLMTVYNLASPGLFT